MTRLLPKSLLGQMALLIVAALLIAQAVNFALILNEREKLQLARRDTPPITRFAAVAANLHRLDMFEQRPRRRMQRFSLGVESIVGGARDAALEEQLREALDEANVSVRAVRAASGTIRMPGPRQREWRLVTLSAQLPDGRWLNARALARPIDRLFIWRLAAGTLALTILVLGPALWIAARIARPLRALRKAADRFDGTRAVEPVHPQGPTEVRHAIEAFNAMNRRVVTLVEEKDRMLGAIGHDLRTPLASLRLRAEGIEPAAERERMIATIADMHQMLEDILALARLGRPTEAERSVDIGALADAVVEEFCELGADVRFEPGARVVATIRPTLLRRAVRHLIDNAVKYAGGAQVSVRAEGGLVRIAIEDDGPGIVPSELNRVREAFYRIEPSRSRETGGTGLGLALAQAIAEAHGGRLDLANRAGGGLSATLVLPNAT